jgi:hypothetical protein
VTRYLRIYMNDQLALGIGWRELARRAEHSNQGTDLGDALGRVAQGIAEDVATFERILERLGLRANPVKTWLAVAGERIGRLKPNGHVRSYSPLSRFVELDVLVMGIDNKRLLWANLRDLAGLGAALPDVAFDELVRRAERQRDELLPFHAGAGAVLAGARGQFAERRT